MTTDQCHSVRSRPSFVQALSRSVAPPHFQTFKCMGDRFPTSLVPVTGAHCTVFSSTLWVGSHILPSRRKESTLHFGRFSAEFIGLEP